jgi:hypothetical protein
MRHGNAISFGIIIYIITLSILVIFSVSSTRIIEYHQAFARCPNGTHKSPSGDCEPVVPHTGLPRCPNGFHRSPSGDCEQFRSSSSPSETDVSSRSTNFDQNDNTVPDLSSPSPSPSASTSSNQCDKSLWDHVYHPDYRWLTIVEVFQAQ